MGAKSNDRVYAQYIYRTCTGSLRHHTSGLCKLYFLIYLDEADTVVYEVMV